MPRFWHPLPPPDGTLGFSRQNLQGCSFDQRDLTSANFSQSDLRGASFRKAILIGANFSQAQMGMTRAWAALLLSFSLIVSALAGVIAARAGNYIQSLLVSTRPTLVFSGFFSTIVLCLFIIIVIWKGWGTALKLVIGITVGVTTIVGGIAILTRLGDGLGAAFVLMTILLTLGAAIAGTLARIVAGTLSNLTYMLVALAGTLVGHNAGGSIVTLAMTVTTVVISKQALAHDRRQQFLYNLAMKLATWRGTNFNQANLTGATFT